jgi:hypothetical protein
MDTIKSYAYEGLMMSHTIPLQKFGQVFNAVVAFQFGHMHGEMRTSIILSLKC